MKNWTHLFIFLSIMVFPMASFANVDGYQINWVMSYGEDDTECAAEGEITSIQGNIINGSERLAVNGTTWGSFANLPTVGYNIGTKFAFGTNSLQVRLNYNFDVALDEGICQNLQAGDVVQFDGSFNDDLASVVLDQPMLQSALALDGMAYTWIDLNQNSLELTNLNGDMITIGSGPLFNTGGGGGGGTGTSTNCSIGAVGSGFQLAWALLFSPLLGAGMWLRRRQE